MIVMSLMLAMIVTMLGAVARRRRTATLVGVRMPALRKRDGQHDGCQCRTDRDDAKGPDHARRLEMSIAIVLHFKWVAARKSSGATKLNNATCPAIRDRFATPSIFTAAAIPQGSTRV